MRRVWAAVLSVWATISVVAVLAWTNAPAPPASQGAALTYVVRGANGSRRLVVVPAGAAHATTRTSPAAASAPQAAGNVLLAAASAPAHASTRTS